MLMKMLGVMMSTMMMSDVAFAVKRNTLGRHIHSWGKEVKGICS